MLIILYAITIINVLVAAGFAIAGLTRPALVASGQQTEAGRVFALYTFARTIPVALVTIAAILWAHVVVVLWLKTSERRLDASQVIESNKDRWCREGESNPYGIASDGF